MYSTQSRAQNDYITRVYPSTAPIPPPCANLTTSNFTTQTQSWAPTYTNEIQLDFFASFEKLTIKMVIYRRQFREKVGWRVVVRQTLDHRHQNIGLSNNQLWQLQRSTYVAATLKPSRRRLGMAPAVVVMLDRVIFSALHHGRL